MEKPVVDVFIPASAGNCDRLAAAIYSALTQSYEPIRVVLWLDQTHEFLETILDKWWYEPADTPRKTLIEEIYPPVPKPVSLEYCKKGVIVRNPSGPSGTAAIARQWVFQWPGKSPFVKFLDSDDILIPKAIEIMMNYVTPDCDGVLCPMLKASSWRFAHVIDGKLEPGHMGSGSILIRKESMERMIAEGFQWPNRTDHDSSFITHCMERGYKFPSTTQTFMYCYLKGP